MGLFSNPLGHAGFPPDVTGTPSTQPSAVRAATLAEANEGVLDNVYISPATAQAATALDFASPPVLGFGSTDPRPVQATTLESSDASRIGYSDGNVEIGNALGQIGFFGSTGATQVAQGAVTNNVAAGGTANIIVNYADLNVYANDATDIRNNFYQIAQVLQTVVGALRSYGLLS